MRAGLDDAIGALYEAATDKSLASWNTALDRVAGLFASAGAVLLPKDYSLLSQMPPTSTEVAEHFGAWVAAGWHHHDPRSERGWKWMERSTVVLDGDVLSDDDRRQSACYQDFYYPREIPGWSSVAFSSGRNRWCMSLVRSDAVGRFERRDIPDLACLSPHLTRILRFSDAAAENLALDRLEWAERRGDGALVLDRDGRVLRIGALASALLGDDLAVRGARLCVADAQSEADLQKLVRSVCNRAIAADPFGPIVVRRRAGRPLIVDAFPLVRVARDLFGGGHTVITIRQLDVRPAPRLGLMRAAFGLTPGEMRVLAALQSEMSVAEAAGHLGLSTETVRRVLKSLFRKTDTNRQSELLLLVERFG